MSQPSIRTAVAATVGGVTHLAVVEILFRYLAHVPESLWPLASIGNAASVFLFGFVVVLMTAHTRLLSPVGGVMALLGWATYREVTSPMPEWSDLGGYLVVDGPVFLTSYQGTWYVWLALFVVAASIEFGLRRQYEVGDAWLRNLPPLPDDRRSGGSIAAVVGSVFGLAVIAWAAGIGVNPTGILPVLLVTTAAAAAVPIGAAVYRGLVTPTVCFAVLVVPPLLRQTFTAAEGGPVFLLLLGPLAVGFAIMGAIEYVLRTRLSGNFGGVLAIPNTK